MSKPPAYFLIVATSSLFSVKFAVPNWVSFWMKLALSSLLMMGVGCSLFEYMPQ